MTTDTLTTEGNEARTAEIHGAASIGLEGEMETIAKSPGKAGAAETLYEEFEEMTREEILDNVTIHIDEIVVE